MFRRRPKVTESELLTAAVIEWFVAETEVITSREALYTAAGENALAVPFENVRRYVEAQQQWDKADGRLIAVAKRWIRFV